MVHLFWSSVTNEKPVIMHYNNSMNHWKHKKKPFVNEKNH